MKRKIIIYMFTFPHSKWIVDDTFIFIQKFCKFLDGVAEVHVPCGEYIPSCASSLDNLVIDRQEKMRSMEGWFMRMLLRRASNIGKDRIDIFMNVAGHSSLGVLATISAIKTKKKSIVRVAGQDVELIKNRRNISRFVAYKFGERVSLRCATRILSVDNNLVPYLTRKGADIDKIHVISQGVDITLFKPVDVKRGYPTVLFVANRLTLEKRPLDFIRVAAEVQKDFPEIKFRVISGEVGLERVKIFADNLKTNVEFLGYVPQEKLPSHYCSSDVLVVTSSLEALPTVILEAMACGTPVIATDVGGVNEAVKEDVTGKLVKVEDIASMKESIIELCSNSEKRKEMGRNAREFVEKHHSYDAVKREYVKLVQDTLDEG